MQDRNLAHCFFVIFDILKKKNSSFFCYCFFSTFSNLMYDIPKFNSGFPLHDEKKELAENINPAHPIYVYYGILVLQYPVTPACLVVLSSVIRLASQKLCFSFRRARKTSCVSQNDLMEDILEHSGINIKYFSSQYNTLTEE